MKGGVEIHRLYLFGKLRNTSEKLDFLDRFNEVKWRTARLEVLLDYYSYGRGIMCCNDHLVRAIPSYLGAKDKPSVELIKQHQKKIMRTKTVEKV